MASGEHLRVEREQNPSNADTALQWCLHLFARLVLDSPFSGMSLDDRNDIESEIEATVLAINAADAERNPPETGVTEAAVKRIKNGKIYLIPASTETRGHLTTGDARFYKQQ